MHSIAQAETRPVTGAGLDPSCYFLYTKSPTPELARAMFTQSTPVGPGLAAEAVAGVTYAEAWATSFTCPEQDHMIWIGWDAEGREILRVRQEGY